LDRAAGVAYVAASDHPEDTQLYAVPVGTKGPPKRIAGTDAGVLRASFSSSAKHFTTHQASLRAMPTHAVMSTSGAVVRTIPSVAETPTSLPTPEILSVGPDRLRVSVLKPRNFDATRRYPVLDAAYAGPHRQVVISDLTRYLHAAWLSEATSALVVGMDARGTPGRGRAWERALAGKLGDVPLEGHVQGMGALFNELPAADPARVGVYGWSFGGYFSALAVLRHPELYRAGMAGAPPADWRDYDTAYTERYLGLPEEQGPAYDDASLLVQASRAKGALRPLLIVHGTADDNVYFFNSLKLASALDAAGRPYQFMPLSGITHQLADPALHERVWSQVAAFFRAELTAKQ
jgi:dipeptidyl-peptidase-4